jgi:hypothetical protein
VKVKTSKKPMLEQAVGKARAVLADFSTVLRYTAAMKTVQVHALWDDEAFVWVATSDDVPGLATGADSLEQLAQKLQVVVPELLEANHLPSQVSIRLEATREMLALA